MLVCCLDDRYLFLVSVVARPGAGIGERADGSRLPDLQRRRAGKGSDKRLPAYPATTKSLQIVDRNNAVWVSPLDKPVVMRPQLFPKSMT
jgi:hypothetical protein